MGLRPHDLIRINIMNDLLKGHSFPCWATASLLVAPYVVVRRSKHDARFVPVGIRGKQRGQRQASWISSENIKEVITPEQLRNPASWKISSKDVTSKQMYSLEQISSLLNESGYEWGPAGSVAFELATGIKTTTESSDLDLIIRINESIPVPVATILLTELEGLSSSPLDIQINFLGGGFSLREYCYSPNVLVKTQDQPVLIKRSEIWNASLVINEAISI